jgi:predicted metal-dependent phosphotriesterase family hydrolase
MRLMTTQGSLGSNQVGAMLAHEHVVADLRPLGEHESSLLHPIDAIRALIEHEVRAALAVGVTAIVEATPVGVGRPSGCHRGDLEGDRDAVRVGDENLP